MNKTRLVSLLLGTSLTLTSLMSACTGSGNTNKTTKKNINRYEGYYLNGEGDIQLDSVTFNDISYRKTNCPSTNSTVVLSLKKEEIQAGESVSATIKVTSVGTYIYYIVDWGDGTRSFQGPYSGTTPGTLSHTYNEPGTYSVRAAAQSIEKDSWTTKGWSESSKITVTGEKVTKQYITNVRAIAYKDDASAIIDNDSDTSYTTRYWTGLEFDTYYSLNTLEFQFAEGESVPEDFSVEYTTDRGENWYSLPRYYYMYEYYVGHDQFYKNFADELLSMSGATICIDMGGVVANGIRIRSRDTTTLSKDMSISEMRVTSTEEGLFYTSYGGMRDADLNNMFTIYGTADTEPTYYWADPFRSGELLLGSAEWIHWNGIKLRWCADESILSQYRATFASIRTGEDTWSGSDGFVWATGSAQKHLDIQSHYTQNSLFIIEARNYLLMQNNVSNFLNSKNSQRQTIMERIDASMKYLCETLEGNSGVLTINDPDNLGKAGYEGGSQSSNYWDRYSAFGYKSSYENIYFYQAVLAYADIKEYNGDMDTAAEYRQLAEKVKKAFNDTFWDAEKGRYISGVNYEGKKLDFGITFTNFMAASLGLASEEQIQLIYQWMDGERIISGDTSTGDDIYYFGYSARANTVDVASIDDNGYYWVNWNGDIYPYEKNGAKHGAYGMCMQNGGTIFYISYYDILGRVEGVSADNAWQRMESILGQFHEENQLRLFPYPTNVGYQSGIIGEFPESGLVPTAFIDAFLGISAGTDGLVIEPNLPEDMDYAGVRRYRFNDTVYEIRIDRNAQAGTIKNNVITVPATGTWIVTTEGKLQLG